MTETPDSAPIREVVGLFDDRAAFDAAVDDLLAAGFDRSDLSVLSSHDSLDAAEHSGFDWGAALAGEYKMVGPLVASGAVFLAGGPVAATIAAVIGAAVGGAAVKELIDEVTSAHHDDFARAMKAGGLVLWARVADTDAEAAARDVLARHGAGSVHRHDRTAD